METKADVLSTDLTQLKNQTSQSSRKRRTLIIKSAISISLIVFILSRINFNQILDVLFNAHLGLLTCAWSLTFIGAFLTASRWRILLSAQEVFTTTRHLIACWMTACFFNQFLPSTIGGDVIRVYDSWKMGATKLGAAAVIGVDRLLGLFSLMIFGVIALYLSSLLLEQHPEIRMLVIGAAIGLGMIAAWIFIPSKSIDSIVDKFIGVLPTKVKNIGIKFQSALTVYRGRTGMLVKGLILSALLQLNVIFFYFLIGSALDLPITFLDYMLIIPVANVVLLLPITINGVGLREGIFILLLSAFGIPIATSIAFAWASFALFTLYGLLGGIVYAIRKEQHHSS